MMKFGPSEIELYMDLARVYTDATGMAAPVDPRSNDGQFLQYLRACFASLPELSVLTDDEIVDGWAVTQAAQVAESCA